MKQRRLILCLVLLCTLGLPFRSPAPLIYTPGEGWTYEPAGGEGQWRKVRAKDQLDVAQKAFDAKDYGLAKKAAERVVTGWPFSDYAPQGQYLLARCSEQLGQDEKAFREYQKLLEKYPKIPNYEDVLQRQFLICNKFLNGERFKLWGYVPTFPSMDKTVTMYEKVIKNGPYSDVAAQSQMNIGTAREKQSRYFNDNEPYEQAAKAYELAADRYHDHPKFAADALYKAGLAYQKQASTAEYDQSTAGQAIATFQEFMTLYPNDPRVLNGEKIIASLKTEQARGNFETAKFYEFNHRWKSALIYYNEVVIKDPNSPYAETAKKRITALKKLTEK
ncbi:MAG TPA: outer membrane protein assembly factor BamD [Verrucomicrobiae bacterium]|jgi:outer membrane protein assembly factor BamD|nr:outer membrane protein assembly factor BamD [Verrucomicrobiae bacterium]